MLGRNRFVVEMRPRCLQLLSHRLFAECWFTLHALHLLPAWNVSWRVGALGFEPQRQTAVDLSPCHQHGTHELFKLLMVVMTKIFHYQLLCLYTIPFWECCQDVRSFVTKTVDTFWFSLRLLCLLAIRRASCASGIYQRLRKMSQRC